MEETYHKWYSQYIGRECEMLVFGTNGVPVILFPPANERFFSAKDNNLLNSLEELISDEKIKVYCPDSFDNDSWYNHNASPEEKAQAYLNFEQLIIYDLIGFTNYETQQKKALLAGCGFGGYHSLNFTLKHPDMVSGMISFNGYYNVKLFVGDFYSDDIYFNNPPDYLPGLEDPWFIEKLKKVRFRLGCSRNVLSAGENYELCSLLKLKNIDCELKFYDYLPDWEICNMLLTQYISSIIG